MCVGGGDLFLFLNVLDLSQDDLKSEFSLHCQSESLHVAWAFLEVWAPCRLVAAFQEGVSQKEAPRSK